MRELREKNDFSYKDTSNLSGVDASTLSRLEEGQTSKVNVMVINSLAKVYRVNPILLLKIIDYVSDEDILEYIKISNTETKAIENKEIEVLNAKGNFNYPKKFLKLSVENIKNVQDYKSIEFNNHIFLYDNSNLNNNDVGIFFINDKITIAYYYFLDSTITLKDYFSSELSMHHKKNLNIFGNIKTIIDFSKNKKQEL